MVTRNKTGMTKTELIKAIEQKLTKAKPMVKNDFIRSLRYRNKAALKRYLTRIRVDGDGSGFRL